MDCAASLLELLQCGLVLLKRPGGQGVLRLYADNEDLDEWWVKCSSGCQMLVGVRQVHRGVRVCHASVVGERQQWGQTGSRWGRSRCVIVADSVCGQKAAVGR